MNQKMDSATENETPDLTFLCGVVSRLVLDYRLTLDVFEGSGSGSLTILTPSTLSPGSDRYEMDPEQIESVAPALSLFMS